MDHNRSEINRMNQRGGRQLSVLDLIDSGTMDLPLASYLAGAVHSGASLLTAAVPGNAGKTTVLASLLPFLPAKRRIVTVSDPALLGQVPGNSCLLAHEIGDGAYFAYLWADSARRYFQSIAPGVNAISCIHADTIEQLRGILCGPQIGLSPQGFARIDLVAFLNFSRQPNGYRRRVCEVWESDGQQHRRIFQWRQKSDEFLAEGGQGRFAGASEGMGALFAGLRAENVRDFEAIYARVSAVSG